MSAHLATLAGILCHTETRWPAKSGDLRDVTCKRCLHRLDRTIEQENEGSFARRRLAASALDAELLGAGHVWSLVANAETPTECLIRDLLAAVFRGLVELDREQVVA